MEPPAELTSEWDAEAAWLEGRWASVVDRVESRLAADRRVRRVTFADRLPRECTGLQEDLLDRLVQQADSFTRAS